MTRITDDQAAGIGRPLHAAIAAALDAGQTVPCIGRPEWTSPRPEDRATAVAECRREPCPVLDQCAATATAAKERHAVWGGTIRGER